ncbi:MAG: hypothetical protein HC888_05350 [Candidatus Competibacteraceae bacterium]|nr:hypothetical protein [Candidatus Competibacteraceae bacterium]
MSIAASVTLRLQAIAAGDPNAEPVTHEELVAALRERIGSRQLSVKPPKEKTVRAKKTKTTPNPSLSAIDLDGAIDL